jgi:hypothetical protein
LASAAVGRTVAADETAADSGTACGSAMADLIKAIVMLAILLEVLWQTGLVHGP